jgi:hypothetical protein
LGQKLAQAHAALGKRGAARCPDVAKSLGGRMPGDFLSSIDRGHRAPDDGRIAYIRAVPQTTTYYSERTGSPLFSLRPMLSANQTF